jgi:type I restriction enzyme S subunit
MNDDWSTVTIANIAADEPYATQIGPFGNKIRAENYTTSGVPVLRGINIADGRFNDNDFVFISEAAADELRQFECKSDDVLLVHKGTLGQVGIMPHRLRFQRYIMGNSMMRVRCNPRKVLPKFLYYWLRSPGGQHYLQSRVSQVGVPQLQRPLTTLREAEFRRPPPEAQHDIVNILDALDEKIEENRLTASAVERLARAIFRAWFVDFEPVKAKTAGATEFPSMSRGIFNALPDTLIESTLGPIPEGWAVGPLRSLLRERKERVEPSIETTRLPYVPIDCIDSEQIFLEQFKSGEEAKSSLVKFFPGDILFGAMRPYFHKVCLAPFEGLTRTTCLVLAPIAESDRAFALMTTSDETTVAFATSHSVGSTIPYAKWDKSLGEMLWVLAPAEIRRAFGDVINPIIERAQLGVRENASLARLRDYLLPRLLTGQVRVEVSHG